MRALAIALVACASTQDVETAKQSHYDADVEIVHAGIVEVMKKEYPNFSSKPHIIKTVWHQVDGMRVVTRRGANEEDKRFFVRFDIELVAPRPWGVVVTGYGARWDAGTALPMQLSGDEVPPYVQQRTERLRVDIHKALAQYAFPK